MIQANNMQLRNLLEQVYKNKEDIKYILTEGRQFDEFGIKVVGQVATVNDLPDPVEYHTAHGDESYGDAYMIGTEPPYTLYILTREFSGMTGPHWFNVGMFPLPGPQGVPGVQGERGERGLQGVQGERGERGLQGIQGIQGIQGVPGVQGPRGPRGEAGVPGNAVSIIGIISTEDELPTPTESIRNNAYLLNKGNNVYDMYIILGESTLVWTNVGEFNSGTQVTVGGSNVATFNADTKLDKVSGSTHRYQVYGTGNDTEGSFKMWSLVNYPVNGAIPLLNPRQTITIDPAFNFSALMDNDAVNKKYVDDKVVGSDPITTEWGNISLKYSGGLTTTDGNLVIQVGDGLTTDTGPLNISGNILNSPGLYSTYGSYIQDNYGNIEINGSGEIELYSKKHLIYNDNFGINLTPDGIILGTYSGSTGEIDKTKPYIEITETAVNIKGLNSIT